MVEDSSLQRRSCGGNRSPQPGDKPGGLLVLAAVLRQRSASFENLQPNNAALSERAMSDTIQRKNPRYGFFDGRNEKRLSMSVPVYLTGLRETPLPRTNDYGKRQSPRCSRDQQAVLAVWRRSAYCPHCGCGFGDGERG